MNVVPYKAQHLLELQLQDAQLGCKPFVTPEYAKALESEFAFTALVDGKPVAVAGVMELWRDRGLAWSFLGRDAGPHMASIHRAALKVLDLVSYRRVEADTPCDFEQGHRWLRMLGFELEAPRMRGFQPNGDDSSLYARVR